MDIHKQASKEQEHGFKISKKYYPLKTIFAKAKITEIDYKEMYKTNKVTTQPNIEIFTINCIQKSLE